MENQKMNFWNFLDNQLERIERNGIGLGMGCFFFALFIIMPILMVTLQRYR